MPQHDTPDSNAANPAAPPPAQPAKVDPVAVAEEYLANMDMKAQREALKKLSRSL